MQRPEPWQYLALLGAIGRTFLGAALIIVGAALVLVAVLWATDYKQLVTRFYARSRQAWDSTPGTGRVYGRVVSAVQFKVLGFLGAALFGLLFIAWGAALIAKV